MNQEIIDRIINFQINAQKYIGWNVEIKEYISTSQDNFDRHFTSFSSFSFELEDLRSRFSGNKMMISGKISHYEIHNDLLIKLENSKEENVYIFLEKLSEKIYRKSILKFKNKI